MTWQVFWKLHVFKTQLYILIVNINSERSKRTKLMMVDHWQWPIVKEYCGAPHNSVGLLYIKYQQK